MKNQIPWIVLLVFFTSFQWAAFTNAQHANSFPFGKKLAPNGVFIADRNEAIGQTFSDNGVFKATYSIGNVTDENRELTGFTLSKEDQPVYGMDILPGADLLVSNSGMVAVFDMDLHFKQQVTVHLYDPAGSPVKSKTFSYASLFGFSPKGNTFVAGTDRTLMVMDLANNRSVNLGSCSQYAFSDDESWLITAREDKLWLYKGLELEAEINTALFYPRAVAVDPDLGLAIVVGKKELKAYQLSDHTLRYESCAPANASYRDVMVYGGLVYAGIHDRQDGVSKGIVRTLDGYGAQVEQKVMAEKQFTAFKEKIKPVKSSTEYTPIPWPFEPFDEVHKVWNHYEQHMGDGSGDWSYLHQGFDLEVPINEPTYAVEEGWVKLVLTIGGDAYWRVAVSPEQSSGYSNGWLYAHLVNSSIQVDVGDYVELHDYLGDIIYWSADWGHIHFVNIRDQGDIWYYDDDEWGINFNPLLALSPITDESAPVIEDFSSSSKFGYCMNETSNYLDPDDLSGEVDIIARISDYHGTSDWEQPGYLTYYWVQKYPEGDTVHPKTLGQILNHTYSMYNSSFYFDYAPILYKKDYYHPSPPWMNLSRDYWQILTNNNGDSVVEPSETELAFNTADFYDGSYQVFVEAWDEYGNMAIDSQVVYFNNGIISGQEEPACLSNIMIYPNPAVDHITINGQRKLIERVTIYTNQFHKVGELVPGQSGGSSNACNISLNNLPSGVYYIRIESGVHATIKKVIKIE
jgi:hypothetical protein